VRALARVAQASRAAGKPCSVCGDVADDPAYAVLLLGLGYDSVSVAPGFHPEIKFAVRRTTAQQAADLASEALAQRNSGGVRALLERTHARLLGEK
jgi:phosphotransferase system enzyme I (PtsP)